MNKCSGCREAYYCGKEYQRTDWKEGGHKEVCRVAQQHQGPGKPRSGEMMMTMMKEMNFMFCQSTFKFVARRTWQVSRRAVETSKVPAAVEGGAARHVESPTLKDFVIYMDYPAGKWMVHLIKGFYDKTDVPIFPHVPDFHSMAVQQVRAQHPKMLQTETSGNARGQFFTLVYAPTGTDMFCFINALQNQKTMEFLSSDALIRETGLDETFADLDELDKATPNGGALKLANNPGDSDRDADRDMRNLLESIRRQSL